MKITDYEVTLLSNSDPLRDVFMHMVEHFINCILLKVTGRSQFTVSIFDDWSVLAVQNGR